MRAPKYYVKINTGFFMTGLHGFQTKKTALAWMNEWFAANPKAKIYDAEVIKA